MFLHLPCSRVTFTPTPAPLPFSRHQHQQQGSSLGIIPGWEVRTYTNNQTLKDEQEETILSEVTYQALPAVLL